MLIFNDVIKSIELLSLTSTDVNEQTTGQYKQGIHRSLIITDSGKYLVKLSTE